MTSVLDLVLRLALWLLLAPLLPGIINKVKAWVAGRRGPPVLQLYYDLARLWQKAVVLSALASPGFIAGPAVASVVLMVRVLLLHLRGDGLAVRKGIVDARPTSNHCRELLGALVANILELRDTDVLHSRKAGTLRGTRVLDRGRVHGLQGRGTEGSCSLLVLRNPVRRCTRSWRN